MKKKTFLLDPWIYLMAWRDSRSQRRRFLLFVSAIVFGIAAIVSIGSFGSDIEKAVDEQARTLLGADLMLSSLRPFPPEIETIVDSLGGIEARELVFGTMAYFEKSKRSRLVQIRAITGEFPFYGEIGTEPPEAAIDYQKGPFALVDEAMMLQFDGSFGDTISIGGIPLSIIGAIHKMPAEPPAASSFNPKIFIPARILQDSNLLQRGSLVNYRIYLAFGESEKADRIVRKFKPMLDEYRIRYETVSSRKERIGDILQNFGGFLSIVGFISLILGSVGVASAVHVYIRQKLTDVAILRCQGAQARQTFAIYLVQVVAMTLAGAALGAVIGVIIQMMLPAILIDFLPVELEPSFSLMSVVNGMSLGLALALLFALLPLLSVRQVSPLSALRASFEQTQKRRQDGLSWIVRVAIIVSIAGFFMWQSANPLFGALFAVAIMVAFAVLAGFARLLTYSVRRFFPASWPYVWRQGLANLYRPNNQTLVLMVAVGLGTFLITTLYLTHETLLSKVTYSAGGDRANLLLYDIQPDQIDDIKQLIRSNGFPILQSAPMVTMRIAAINGEDVVSILSDSTKEVHRGLLRWEYRTTYRDTLYESEDIVAGKWIARSGTGDGIIPISFDDGSAERLNITLGDTIVWDVQGLSMMTRVASLRKVDWQRIQANFMVVFPTGVLEKAPQIYILASKAPNAELSARVQGRIVEAHPNVSIIDLELVLHTIDALLDKVAFAIRFMAFFSIFAGLVVLASAVITSRFQRAQEVILLRTLGASRNQVTRIMAIEYLFLGCFAALTGLLLSYALSWGLALWVFKSVFIPTLLPFVVVVVAVAGLTITIGMLNSRGLFDRPPLEILRSEAV